MSALESPAMAPELNGTFLSHYNDPLAVTLDGSRIEWSRSRPLTLQAYPSSGGDGRAPELILDENNLLPFAFLRQGDRVGRAVVKILRGDGAAGTGFLVAPDILLTNHHVLPDRGTAAQARALANYEIEPPDDPAGRPALVSLRPDDLFVTSAELDFTFCGVRGLEHLGAIALERDGLEIRCSDFVNIIQHPRGRPKEVALQDNLVVRADSVALHYSCDTEPGSSGSPVFDNRWRLVALHHASIEVDEALGGRRARDADPRRRYLNEGIRLSAIALWLESDEAKSPALRPQTDRLRSLFQGHDPRAGFFGTLGQVTDAPNMLQWIVECYQNNGDRLDLGAWNLNEPETAPPQHDRLPDIAQVLAQMNLDLWFLNGLDTDEARRLRNRLERQYRLEYEATTMPALSGNPWTILQRRSAPLQVEPSEVIGSCVASVGPTGSKGARHLLTIALRGPDDHLMDAAGTDPGESLLIVLGQHLDQGSLSTPRLSARLAASGFDGSLLVQQDGGGSTIERLFLSPNLAPVLGPPTALSVSQDRALPILARSVSGHGPLAVRLLFGSPPEPTPPPSAANPDLEESLASLLSPIIARLIGQAHGQSPSALDGSGPGRSAPERSRNPSKSSGDRTFPARRRLDR